MSQIIGYGYLIGAVLFFFIYWIDGCYTAGKQGKLCPDEEAVFTASLSCILWPFNLAINAIELIQTKAYKAGLAHRKKELNDVNKEEGPSDSIG